MRYYMRLKIRCKILYDIVFGLGDTSLIRTHHSTHCAKERFDCVRRVFAFGS